MSGFLLNPYSYSSIAAGDPYWANVRNLIGFENGVADEKTGVNWQVQGTLPPSASAAKFGNYGLPATTSANNYWLYDSGASISIPTTRFVTIGTQRGGASPANTKIDEFRITVGGSRGAPTTIPTTAFPRSA